MTQQRQRNRNDFNHSKQQIIEKILHFTLALIMVFQQLQTTAAAQFKGDTCFAKNEAGICKEWGECPIIKTLIESGEYTNREVVSCGFGIREELICCPVRSTPSDGNKDRSGERSPTTPTTTDAPDKDFWLDLIQNTKTSTTTAVPDFWLDLLKPTAPATTTSTTLKPLIIGEQKLNESSEFFDFNVLLGGNQNLGGKQPQPVFLSIQPNKNLLNSQAGFTANENNGRGNNLSTDFQQTANNINIGRDHNGPSHFPSHGHNNFVWGQQNSARGNTQRTQGLSRGPPNHLNNGRGPFSNNDRFQSNWARENRNQGFNFPQNNVRPNNIFGPQQSNSNQRQGNSLANNMSEQNQNSSNNNKNKDNGVDDLINYIFTNSEFAPDNSNLNQSKNPFFNSPQNFKGLPTGEWFTSQQNNHNNHHVKDLVNVPTATHREQLAHRNPQVPQEFEVITFPGSLVNGHGLEETLATNSIQQPVVIQTWPTNINPQHSFNPIQVVHENLINSGLEIIKAEEEVPTLNHQHPQVVVIQSQIPVQPPAQVIYPQQYFGEQMMESASKGPRSTSRLPSPGQQTDTIPLLNVQSPPGKILDPFKPFEFRPPLAEENTFVEDNNSLSPNSSNRTDTRNSTDRPAVRACQRIEKNLPPSLSHHILGGVPAEWGEFPHMAAIGYSRIGGGDRPPYDIRCGGTLIDSRFVLTAAHCVSERGNEPSIVRLGVVNFTDVKQMSTAVEMRIKKTYIHEEYRTRLTYNDIAILELERDVEYSEYIYPVCLYTDLRDPQSEIELWVTGWGTINTTTRSFSDILLKAPLHTSPLENCNKSFTDYGLNRRIPEGIIRSQFCAEDKDQIKDACQGDSGGPLNLVVDKSFKNYRLVGVVSSGFGCASSTPGLYTRVSAFLDFIEKFVWPNGGD